MARPRTHERNYEVDRTIRPSGVRLASVGRGSVG